MMESSFYSHGKLLLTAEYLVLDGAEALALPTIKGQHLHIKPFLDTNITWTSILANGKEWFTQIFQLPLDINKDSGNDISNTLLKILKAAQQLNPSFLKDQSGYSITSTLEFSRDWGLGSSSTLISNIAAWANVNPYELLEQTFGGSGYDIACATATTPILYKRDKISPTITAVDFNPSFKDQLFFVHLNRKQNSRESINQYASLDLKDKAQAITVFSNLSKSLLECTNLKDFESILNTHEDKLSQLLKRETIKKELFSDYPNTIKSLGGWGGDFILATGDTSHQQYFISKGYKTVIPYTEMILPLQRES